MLYKRRELRKGIIFRNYKLISKNAFKIVKDNTECKIITLFGIEELRINNFAVEQFPIYS